MCWHTCNKNILQKKTAKKDIKVIKILLKNEDGAFVSPYKKTEYRVNEIYRSEIGNPIESLKHDMWGILEGLHSYSTKICFEFYNCSAIRIMPPKDTPQIMLDYWCYFSDAVIFEGVIPNGSEYYENEYGELVSNELKVISVIAEINEALVCSSNKLRSLNRRIHNL